MNQLSDVIEVICTEPHTSVRAIADRLDISKSSVQRYRSLIRRARHTWRKLKRMTPEKLDALFNSRARRLNHQTPNFTHASEELSHKGVTLKLLWKEYRARYRSRALSYPRFAHLFRVHGRRSAPVVMRQNHPPGHTAFVDYSGARPWYVDGATGQKVEVEMFVGVLAASNYMFVYCTHTQNEMDWLEANTRMLEHFGGSPKIIVPDNLRAAVSKAGRGDGKLQRDYERFAQHYGIAIHPARAYKPRDKGKVEGAVLIAQRSILAPLRKRVFTSLEEINAVFARSLRALNAQEFQKLPSSRRDVFLATEKSTLMALPTTRYVHREWTKPQTVPRDYHVKVMDHFYSVPYTRVAQKVQARVTCDTVRIFCSRACVAEHARSPIKGAHTTDPAHQAPAHRAQAQRSREGYLHWAQALGPNTHRIVAHQFDQKVPLQGLMACDALKNLAHKEGDQALETAAEKAIKRNRRTVAGVKAALGIPSAVRTKRGPSHASYARSRRAHRREGVGVTPRKKASIA